VITVAVDPDLTNTRSKLLVNLDQLNLIIIFLQQLVNTIHPTRLATSQDD